MRRLADTVDLAALAAALVARERRMLRTVRVVPAAVAVLVAASPDPRPTARTVAAIRPPADATAAEIIGRLAAAAGPSDRAVRDTLAHSRTFAELRENAADVDGCSLTRSTRLLRWLELPVVDGYGQTRCRYEQLRDRWLSLDVLLSRT